MRLLKWWRILSRMWQVPPVPEARYRIRVCPMVGDVVYAEVEVEAMAITEGANVRVVSLHDIEIPAIRDAVITGVNVRVPVLDAWTDWPAIQHYQHHVAPGDTIYFGAFNVTAFIAHDTAAVRK